MPRVEEPSFPFRAVVVESESTSTGDRASDATLLKFSEWSGDSIRFLATGLRTYLQIDTRSRLVCGDIVKIDLVPGHVEGLTLVGEVNQVTSMPSDRYVVRIGFDELDSKDCRRVEACWKEWAGQ